MGLNPGDGSKAAELRQKILDDQFNSGSPYYGMFHCGYYGVPLDECIAKCQRNGIVLRRKDLQAYNDGAMKRGMVGLQVDARIRQLVSQPTVPFENLKLEDFPKIPVSWMPNQQRFFPCTHDNKPMQPWGWKKREDGSVFKPNLYMRWQAEQLSPCRWVGQNMLYQRFIVLDIDGRGHGAYDANVIAFGNQFRQYTFTTEDPMKPGSFHLYFETDRLIPVRHFIWAKLDLMGNAVNAAVYFKNKVSNGVPPMKMDSNVWNAMMQYQINRKEK